MVPVQASLGRGIRDRMHKLELTDFLSRDDRKKIRENPWKSVAGVSA